MPKDDFRRIDELVLVYRSEGTGEYHDQRAADLVESGTLIDPDGPTMGDDMQIVGYRLI
ncbi:hypothetical protein ABIE52_006722 [Rhodococcus sp. OAS809]